MRLWEQPLARRGWAWPRSRARPWCRRRYPRRNIDHASHAILAVRGAEVRIRARLRKSVLINRACVGKNSRLAVGIIRGTKLPIGRARHAAGDTVATTGPGPSHRVARRDVEHVRHKLKALPDRHIENLTVSRWHAVRGLSAVLIDNANGRNSALFLCRDSDEPVTRFS